MIGTGWAAGPLRSLFALGAAAALLLVQDDGHAVQAGSRDYQWVTLGTQGGPVPSAQRGEPANLLVRDGEAHLIDVGDGAASRMVVAGAGYPWLRSIFISHIHFDHIGGLFGVLGLRLQTRTTRPLTIYGPPGTKRIVDGLIAAMRPSAQSGFGVPGEVPVPPDSGIAVVELRDGSTVRVGDMTVRSVSNTHYSFPPGSPLAGRYASLSYRFDLPGRSIVYTGDTGPSRAVETLARGADILVTEMIDLDATLAVLKRYGAHIAPAELANMAMHLKAHHLTTQDVAALARGADVKSVVVTHIGGGAAPDAAPRYAGEIARGFTGKVSIANDLDRF